jgi:hypothetical protein
MANYGKVAANNATQMGASSIANPMGAATPLPTVTKLYRLQAAASFSDINSGIGNLFSDVTSGDFSTAWDQLKTASGETVNVPESTSQSYPVVGESDKYMTMAEAADAGVSLDTSIVKPA